jgi:hypothetical protein
MSIYQIMFSGPSDVEREREAFFASIESCNRLLRIVQKDIAVLPLHWKTNPVVHILGRPQETINRQLLTQADALIAVFRSRFGTPTGRADSGTMEEVEEAMRRGIPCLVCFFDGKQRIADLDQFKKVQDFKKKLEKELLILPYISPIQLQSHLTEWLFALFFLEPRAPKNLDQNHLKDIQKISEYLSAAMPISNVLYTIAGTKAEALSSLRIGQDLASFALIHGWKVEVKSDVEVAAMRQDKSWLLASSARLSEIVLDSSNHTLETDKIGYVIFDFKNYVLYLDESLRLRLEEMMLGLTEAAKPDTDIE